MTSSLGERRRVAVDLLLRFAERTGVLGEGGGRRYLWTDAFAVHAFLGLARATGEPRHTEHALALVRRVHRVLGQHRPDGPRTGWISGLAPSEGEAHPTRGGLRIGKPLPERGPTEAYDADLEWDRDGQYFHYLTKWMSALDHVGRATGQALFNEWARDLARAAHRAFVHTPSAGSPPRMYWKMSVDLSRPLVRSMGQHDPLDGYVTCAQLAATASALSDPRGAPALVEEMATFRAMLDDAQIETADPLGLGGLLSDAHRVDQLAREGHLDAALRDDLLRAALAGLAGFAAEREILAPADRRLAFRELGLCIGLSGVGAMRETLAAEPGRDEDAEEAALLEVFRRYEPFRDRIVAFWLDPEHQRAATWTEHRDINEVMLATALVPEGFLVLPEPARP